MSVVLHTVYTLDSWKPQTIQPPADKPCQAAFCFLLARLNGSVGMTICPLEFIQWMYAHCQEMYIAFTQFIASLPSNAHISLEKCRARTYICGSIHPRFPYAFVLLLPNNRVIVGAPQRQFNFAIQQLLGCTLPLYMPAWHRTYLSQQQVCTDIVHAVQLRDHTLHQQIICPPVDIDPAFKSRIMAQYGVSRTAANGFHFLQNMTIIITNCKDPLYIYMHRIPVIVNKFQKRQ